MHSHRAPSLLNEHATTPTAEAADFVYDAPRLSQVASSPIVDLNRAINAAITGGENACLILLDTLHETCTWGSSVCSAPRALTCSVAQAARWCSAAPPFGQRG